MQQVKIFKSIESDVGAMEAEVNEWIAQSGARVVSITGNIAPQSERVGPSGDSMGQTRFVPSDVVLFVFYETS